MSNSLVDSLTPRELVLLRRLGEDRSNAEIAAVEMLAVSSVKWYLQRIFSKLGVSNRRQAVTRARELGLLESNRPAIEIQHPGPTSNLPRRRTAYFGRVDSIALLITWLDETPLITLTGSGGVGKTSLAIQVAEAVQERFPGGTWLVELAAVTNPGAVAKSVAAALCLQEETSRPIEDTLLDYLRNKSILIILDNCEHLVETCARLADEILTTCSKVRLLATSREPFNVSGEKVYRVPSMQFPDPDALPSLELFQQFDAVRLLVERAQAVQPGFAATEENARSIAQVCQRLDGIPLAIELAAARLNVLNVEQLAGRLDHAVRLLTGGTRTALARHQTLRATIDWSYHLLNEAEKVLLNRLSGFSGSFDLEAAEAVCGFGVLAAGPAGEPIGEPAGEMLDLMAALVAKSLVIAESMPQVGMRYHLLEVVRQYLREKLFEAGESQPLRDRHLDYYVALAARAEPHLFSVGRLMWTKRLKNDMDNIREAMDWAYQDPATAYKGLLIQVAISGWFLFINGSLREDINWLQKCLLLSADQAISPLLEAKVMIVLARLYMFLKDTEQRMFWAEKCIRLCRAIGPTADVELSMALSHYANSYARITKDYAGARVWKDESVQVARRLGPAGSFYLALALYMRVRNSEDPHQGYQDALESYRLFNESGDRWTAALPLWRLGTFAEMENDDTQALRYYEEALSLSEEGEAPINISYSLLYLGRLCCKMADFERAITCHLEYIRIWSQRGGREALAEGLAHVALDEYYRNREMLHQSGKDPSWQDALTRVTMLIAAAEKQRIQDDYVYLLDQGLVLIDEAQETARRELGERAYQTAWERGQAMSLDDAVAFAETQSHLLPSQRKV